jgi:hypothetical protein
VLDHARSAGISTLPFQRSFGRARKSVSCETTEPIGISRV